MQTVLLDEGSNIKTATVVVPDRQLSLAIGKEGQNARLAAKLTGWRIDIKSESEARDEGIDRIVMERAQEVALRATDDLLAKAERILRQEGDVPDDRLWQAAQALREMVSRDVEGPETLPPDFKPLEELVKRCRRDRAAAALLARRRSMLRNCRVGLPASCGRCSVAACFGRTATGYAQPNRHFPRTRRLRAGREGLPEVITADMLRARMAERKKVVMDERLRDSSRAARRVWKRCEARTCRRGMGR